MRTLSSTYIKSCTGIFIAHTHTQAKKKQFISKQACFRRDSLHRLVDPELGLGGHGLAGARARAGADDDGEGVQVGGLATDWGVGALDDVGGEGEGRRAAGMVARAEGEGRGLGLSAWDRLHGVAGACGDRCLVLVLVRHWANVLADEVELNADLCEGSGVGLEGGQEGGAIGRGEAHGADGGGGVVEGAAGEGGDEGHTIPWMRPCLQTENACRGLFSVVDFIHTMWAGVQGHATQGEGVGVPQSIF